MRLCTPLEKYSTGTIWVVYYYGALRYIYFIFIKKQSRNLSRLSSLLKFESKCQSQHIICRLMPTSHRIWPPSCLALNNQVRALAWHHDGQPI